MRPPSPPVRYLMLKPPLRVAGGIDALRHEYSIPTTYAASRLHTTLLKLGDDPAMLARVVHALADFAALRFRIVFDLLAGGTLRPSESVLGLVAFHDRLTAHLVRRGLRLPRYSFDPHISLTYGERPAGQFSIDAISWQVEAFWLIESHAGRHSPLARWQLTPPNPARYRDTGRDRLPSPAAP